MLVMQSQAGSPSQSNSSRYLPKEKNDCKLTYNDILRELITLTILLINYSNFIVFFRSVKVEGNM